MVGGARDPSGYNRSGAFWTARHWSLTTEQSPDFQSNVQGRLP